jgi:predicted nuclease of predicted toxin-antitoxin system
MCPLLSRVVSCCAMWMCSLPNSTMQQNWTIPTCWDRARQLNRVLVSQDEDMLVEAALRQREGIPFTGLIYAHQLRITIGRFIDELELIASVGEPEDLDGRVEFLPL